ncbi:unnamed protein product [Lymnaea stagnalis]|uniref:Uncharacterized protein n=1 Tax=Lymnaea stagnalis TaxID=6523 RepID=A0AAV2HHW0_LYMST
MFKELIRSMVDLTVLLTVSVAKDVNTSRHLKIGNGWVGSLTIYDNDELNPTCGCKKCISSYNPSTKYADIVIYTTTDVVQNDKEAKSTTCRLFYNDSNSEMTIIEDVNEECEISVEQKKCKLTFVTCNNEIIEKLNDASLKWFERYTKVNKRHYKNRDEHKAVIIVSHIHGLHKRISIGKWIDRKEHISSEYGKITRYIYNTPTCSGSAGAYVYIVSRDKKGWLSQHFHHGVIRNEYKFCGVGTDYGAKERK